MPKKRKGNDTSNPPATPDDFINQLNPEMKPAVLVLRDCVLGASPKISEGIKWNSLSFKVHEYFATINLRTNGIMLVLHLGAKVNDKDGRVVKIQGASKILQWPSPNRAITHFTSVKEITNNAKAIKSIIQQWITYLN